MLPTLSLSLSEDTLQIQVLEKASSDLKSHSPQCCTCVSVNCEDQQDYGWSLQLQILDHSSLDAPHHSIGTRSAQNSHPAFTPSESEVLFLLLRGHKDNGHPHPHWLWFNNLTLTWTHFLLKMKTSASVIACSSNACTGETKVGGSLQIKRFSDSLNICIFRLFCQKHAPEGQEPTQRGEFPKWA